MAKTFKLEIQTPEHTAFSADVEEVRIPTSNGEIGVLAGHEYLITDVKPGELTIKVGNKTDLFAVGDGFVKITGEKVSIISDLAAGSEDIEEAEVEKARTAAEKAMSEKHALSEEEFAVAAANLQKALAQLRVKRRRKG